MKRIATLLVLLLFAVLPLFADTPKKEEQFNENKAFKNKVFEVHNRSAGDLAATVRLLGSGFQGAGLSVNDDLHTITVRDFPENIAAIEEALSRLDRPEVSPEVSLNIAILIGSKTPLPGTAAIPEDLAPVVKQLQSTLRYANYGLLAAAMHRTKAGLGLDNSGVAEPSLLGMTAKEERPVFYSYHLHEIGVSDQTVSVAGFRFSMKVPVEMGNGSGSQYQDVGFDTPVNLRQNEKVVIGTTTMGDKALIVVVTAKVEK
jgi:hypothetical protein